MSIPKQQSQSIHPGQQSSEVPTKSNVDTGNSTVLIDLSHLATKSDLNNLQTELRDMRDDIAKLVISELDGHIKQTVETAVDGRVLVLNQQIIQRTNSLEFQCNQQQGTFTQQQKTLAGIPGIIETRLAEELGSRNIVIQGAIDIIEGSAARLATMEENIEYNAKSDRLDTLIIEGIHHAHGKTLKENVSDMFLEEMNLDIQPRDLRYGGRYSGPSLKVHFFDINVEIEV